MAVFLSDAIILSQSGLGNGCCQHFHLSPKL